MYPGNCEHVIGRSTNPVHFDVPAYFIHSSWSFWLDFAASCFSRSAFVNFVLFFLFAWNLICTNVEDLLVSNKMISRSVRVVFASTSFPEVICPTDLSLGRWS